MSLSRKREDIEGENGGEKEDSAMGDLDSNLKFTMKARWLSKITHSRRWSKASRSRSAGNTSIVCSIFNHSRRPFHNPQFQFFCGRRKIRVCDEMVTAA